MKNLSLLIFLFGIGLLFPSCSSKPKEEKKPNIIFILADDMGYGDLKAFNPGSKIRTPHLDQLVKEGMIFTDAHTTSAVCTPSRYALLTGRYNWRSSLKKGVLTGESMALIPKERTTVASLLKSKGYQTAFVGKWHLGLDWALKVDSISQIGAGESVNYDLVDFSKPVQNGPNTLGFEYSYALPASLDMAPYVYVENGKVTQEPDRVTIDEGEYSWWRKGPTSPDFIHEEVTPNFFTRAIQYIENQSKEEEPFFLYLALPSPHTPILPSEAWQGKSGLLPYADFVLMIDDYIGQVNQALKAAGIEENTLVIFSSDNGCAPAAGFNKLVEMGHYPSAHFRGHKADIYEGGHRVPFIAKWPSKIKAGSSRNETISLIDFFATVAEIVDYSISDHEGEDSYSLLPLFNSENQPNGFREATVFHSVDGSFAIRKGDWKLILAKGSGGWSFPRPGDPAEADLPEVQLYNLAIDPGEAKNLEAEEKEKVLELKQTLIRYIQEGRSTPGIPQSNDSFEGEWKQVWFMNEE
ncbi:arylsulfatase A-like enzyme [Algoriphagus boseongensis]|uniref:Arylsulfatase A-like enzyme n=1 Tax=Algoriphagus boseongensis TaxID=1442587 RepID=A0A4R6T0F6_9BACT|nr:arylsulfatase [Algoriphagus boseongensis]TDQ13710.1 arylsulfatase A-like enzyme [Algoriphagus boseongensis]